MGFCASSTPLDLGLLSCLRCMVNVGPQRALFLCDKTDTGDTADTFNLNTSDSVDSAVGDHPTGASTPNAVLVSFDADARVVHKEWFCLDVGHKVHTWVHFPLITLSRRS
ncbi:hypothetical protein KIPB_007782 [Kipferlia bialata]|uniref:Uncharacterized protein n=1 Tax=Kipferlia bialata TaxID=797122 RepID=A0A391NN64_9EUKA|nr:hypothetical protein KIPB_007782 [Kipferlia bialata]|eukprot:g7782.t1